MLNLPLYFSLRMEIPPASITYFKLDKNFEVKDYTLSYSQHLVEIIEEPIKREKVAASKIVYAAIRKDREDEIKWIRDMGFEEIKEKNGWIIFRRKIL